MSGLCQTRVTRMSCDCTSKPIPYETHDRGSTPEKDPQWVRQHNVYMMVWLSCWGEPAISLFMELGACFYLIDWFRCTAAPTETCEPVVHTTILTLGESVDSVSRLMPSQVRSCHASGHQVIGQILVTRQVDSWASHVPPQVPQTVYALQSHVYIYYFSWSTISKVTRSWVAALAYGIEGLWVRFSSGVIDSAGRGPFYLKEYTAPIAIIYVP